MSASSFEPSIELIGLGVIVVVALLARFRWLLRRGFQLLVENLVFGKTEPEFPLFLEGYFDPARDVLQKRTAAISDYFRRRPRLTPVYKATSDRTVDAAPEAKISSVLIRLDEGVDEEDKFFEFLEVPPSLDQYYKGDMRPIEGYQELIGQLVRLNEEQRSQDRDALVLARIADAAVLADRRYSWEFERQVRLESATLHKIDSRTSGFEPAPFFERIYLERRPSNPLLRLIAVFLGGSRRCVVIEARSDFAQYFRTTLKRDRKWLAAGIEFRRPRATSNVEFWQSRDAPTSVCVAARVRAEGIVGGELHRSDVDTQSGQILATHRALIAAELSVHRACPSTAHLTLRQSDGCTHAPPISFLQLDSAGQMAVPCRIQMPFQGCAPHLKRRAKQSAFSSGSVGGRRPRWFSQLHKVRVVPIRRVAAHYSAAHQRVYRFPTLEVRPTFVARFLSKKAQRVVPGELLFEAGADVVVGVIADSFAKEMGGGLLIPSHLFMEYLRWVVSYLDSPHGYDDGTARPAAVSAARTRSQFTLWVRS